MPTSDTTATLGKSGQEWQDTCQNENNTTCYWNTSRVQQIKLMGSCAKKTMMTEATLTMTM